MDLRGLEKHVCVFVCARAWEYEFILDEFYGFHQIIRGTCDTKSY